ncbi:MAG: hypothetical protein ACFFD4_06565 [Candidatus Odinarchaeota archaeon]
MTEEETSTAEEEKKPVKRTRKVKEQKITCKKCSTVINPKDHPPGKTWEMISPMPDKEGNVTLTIMGSFRCPNPNCGKSVIAALRKIKGADIGSGKSKHELLMEYIEGLKEKEPVSQVAEVVGINVDKIEKALSALIKRGKIKGRLEGNYYVPEG